MKIIDKSFSLTINVDLPVGPATEAEKMIERDIQKLLKDYKNAGKIRKFSTRKKTVERDIQKPQKSEISENK